MHWFVDSLMKIYLKHEFWNTPSSVHIMHRQTRSVHKEDDAFCRPLYLHSRCSQAYLVHFQMLPGLLLLLPGLLLVLTCLLPVPPGAPLVITSPSTSSLHFLSTYRCTGQLLHRSSHLWDLTTLGFWFDNSEKIQWQSSILLMYCTLMDSYWDE